MSDLRRRWLAHRVAMAPTDVTIVVCSGISDIGKGWLTATIGSLAPEDTLPIKIDPMLNLGIPTNVGEDIDAVCSDAECRSFRASRESSGPRDTWTMTDDSVTYGRAGLTVYPDCNIVAGDLLQRFLVSRVPEIRPGEAKKRTFADVSAFLADEIVQVVRRHPARHVLIEVGGTIEDEETAYIPGAMRLLADRSRLAVTPGLVLLTYFEFAESSDPKRWRVKTQGIRAGVRRLASYAPLPLRACFARRRGVPESEVRDAQLLAELENVAHETQLPAGVFHLLPNADAPSDPALRACVGRALVRPATQPVLVSACLLGIPCPYDGAPASLQLDPALLRHAGLHPVPVCPEQLGGLPTPRSACELQGGDGNAVLAGSARVLSADGVDQTDAFLRGAAHTLALARAAGTGWMIAQRRSPSCSCAGVYDGSFGRRRIDGVGVTCAVLQSAGITVVQADEAADALSRGELPAAGATIRPPRAPGG